VQTLNNHGARTSTILESWSLSKGVIVEEPTTLLTDHDGLTNLNLQRNKLTKTDVKLSAALRESIANDLVAQAVAFAPEIAPFSKSTSVKDKSRIVNARFSLSFEDFGGWRVTDLSSPWCWEDGGWRIAHPALALKKDRLLALYNNFDSSYLEGIPENLRGTSVIWVKSGASKNNTGDLKQALRHLTRGRSFLGRYERTHFGGYDFPVGFELVVSSSAFERLRQGSAPNYLTPILNSAQELGSDLVCLSNLDSSDSVGAAFKKGLVSKPSEGFAYVMVHGSSRRSLEKQDLFANTWLELVGEIAIPLNFEDRKNAFPKVFQKLGNRIAFYRNQLS
jgi:hypothetical protein